jgi:hypothetical protein
MHHLSAALEEQIFTAIMLLIADRIDPEMLKAIHDMDLNDPRMAQHLFQHNVKEYQKLLAKYNPDGSVKAAAPVAPAPNAQRPRMPNGQIDRDLEAMLVLGQPTKLNDALVSGAGTLDFQVPVHTSAESDFSLIAQAVGTVTTLTAALQASLDGGTTFNDVVASGSFISNTTPAKVVTPIISGGCIWRVNITTATGSQDIWVAAN